VSLSEILKIGFPVFHAPMAGGLGIGRCRVIRTRCPPIISFHFGLPPYDLIERIRSWGTIIS
jgi:hypothetical protein